MHRIEKLRASIESLKDSLALDWSDLAQSPTNERRDDIEHHLEWCLAEMKKLSQRLRDSKLKQDAARL